MQGNDTLVRQAEKDIQRAVTTMLALKLQAGTTPLELKEFVSKCLSEAIKSHKPRARRQMIGLYQIARVLRTWHLETRFLTASGGPRPLKLLGTNGLESLIRIHFPKPMITLVLTTMRQNGLIRLRKTGHWVPTSRYARTPKPTIELLSHFAEGVSRLAETVGRNTASRRKGELLLEKAAQVSDLPRKEAKAFQKYAQTQGMAFLTAMDDWLESRSHVKPRPSEDVCSAGVFAFAFIDDEKPKVRMRGFR
jgi:hypothetical protein